MFVYVFGIPIFVEQLLTCKQKTFIENLEKSSFIRVKQLNYVNGSNRSNLILFTEPYPQTINYSESLSNMRMIMLIVIE